MAPDAPTSGVSSPGLTITWASDAAAPQKVEQCKAEAHLVFDIIAENPHRHVVAKMQPTAVHEDWR